LKALERREGVYKALERPEWIKKTLERMSSSRRSLRNKPEGVKKGQVGWS
jgi:hypothetical protein